MDKKSLFMAMYSKTHLGQDVVINVSGDSMFPYIKSGDTVNIEYCIDYCPGDILAFLYKNNGNEELILHRLLKIKDGYYICKGDNSFRMEIVSERKIIGKVVKINGEIFKSCDREFLFNSYKIGLLFKQNAYNINKTVKTDEYRSYYNKYLSEKC